MVKPPVPEMLPTIVVDRPMVLATVGCEFVERCIVADRRLGG
jgi:hypothetical protein